MNCKTENELSSPTIEMPRCPGRLVNPRLILFSLYFSLFISFFIDMASSCLALYSPRRRLSGWKGVDRLALPCRFKKIGILPLYSSAKTD
jgi:hypothetical protein